MSSAHLRIFVDTKGPEEGRPVLSVGPFVGKVCQDNVFTPKLLEDVVSRKRHEQRADREKQIFAQHSKHMVFSTAALEYMRVLYGVHAHPNPNI